jgi:subtilisin-like proprotein convertase family protein
MRSILIAAALAVLMSAAFAQASDQAPHVTAGTIHRIALEPDDPALLWLVDQGAVRHVEDYGSFLFVLFDETPLGGRPALAAFGPSLRDEDAVVGFNGAPLDTADRAGLEALLAAIPASLRAGAGPFRSPSGRELRVVQFIGPVKDAWIEALEATGARIVSPVASNAYVVMADVAASRRLDDLRHDPSVQWIGDYEPAFRLSPGLRSRAAAAGPSSTDVTVQLIADEEALPLLFAFYEAGIAELRPPSLVMNFVNLHFAIPDEYLGLLASHPSVFGVEELPEERLLDEVQAQIVAGNVVSGGSAPSAPGYLSWLASKGFANGQFAFVVDVTDDGVDRGSTTDVNVEFRAGGSAGGASRVLYNHNYTGDPAADSGRGHGNLNASIAGGFNSLGGTAYEDASGYNFGLGICPFVGLGNTKVFSNGNAATFTQPTATRLQAAYAGGARISSNSWAYVSGNNYNFDSQAHDAIVRDAAAGAAGNQEMTIVFAGGNSGPNANTVRPPGTAKNIITVGAQESYRPTGTDGCAIQSTGANNANEITPFSSRGPTADLRKKPDLVAPGSHVQGAVSRSPSYTGASVCNPYWPTGQTLYTWSSGTSHAAPAVAGAAALVRQQFVNQGLPAPSAAMVKAMLTGSARYLTGSGANDALWSNSQGFGAVDLGRAFNGVSRILVDQTQVLGSTGQTWSVSGTVSTSAQPFRVALVWTDKPGPTTGNAWVNNLDLEVNLNGTLYRGNVFGGQASVAGGAADTRNNVECVFLPAGTSGTFTVTVKASNVAGDGVPGNADTTDQDFALVVLNATQTSSPPPQTPNFTLAASPSSRTVTRGQSTSYVVANSATGGFGSQVTLSVSPAISGVTYALSPNPEPANGSSTLTVSTTASAATGTFTLTITGTGGGLTRTTTVTLVINATTSGSQVKTYTVTPGAAIPDASVNGVTSSVSVPLSQTITSVAVSASITHGAIGQLKVTLIAPNGTQKILHNQTGGTADNLVTTWPIVTAPAESLAAFNGLGTAGTWSLKVQDLSSGETGTLGSWTLTFNGEKSASPNASVPDGSTTGVTSTLAYTATGTVAAVKVRVNVTHPNRGHLHVTLIAPDGTQVVLHNQSGGTADHLQTEYPDLTAPAGSLSGLAGKSIAGNWSLKVRDLVSGSTGTFASWTLSLRAQ